MMKFMAIFLVAALMLPVCVPASAAELTMSDAEFSEAVAEIMKDYYADTDAARLKLAEIGAFLEAEPVIFTHNADSVNQARTAGFQDYKFYVASIRRSNSTLRYLQWHVHASANEMFPGPYDYVSLEWDPAYASYYDSYGDGTYTSVAGRSTGIVLFNMDDGLLESGEYCYGTVRVDPIQTGTMEYGSKFSHTYTILNFTGTASWSFAPSLDLSLSGEASLGIAGNSGFSVSVGTSTAKWDTWADNAVTFN